MIGCFYAGFKRLMPIFQNLDHLHYPPLPENAREEVERMLRALVEDYGAEKIIAFGSAVRGGVTEHSDIDLCVVRQHPASSTHPTLEAGLAVARAGTLVSKDILVRTPNQMEEARKRPFGVMEEIVNHGVTVYER
jgi:predicted nucleotidyltransferase